ncbi:hypothetical protein Aperf_G00000010219 [Anoplocephala perfoliata]
MSASGSELPVTPSGSPELLCEEFRECPPARRPYQIDQSRMSLQPCQADHSRMFGQPCQIDQSGVFEQHCQMDYCRMVEQPCHAELPKMIGQPCQLDQSKMVRPSCQVDQSKMIGQTCHFRQPGMVGPSFQVGQTAMMGQPCSSGSSGQISQDCGPDREVNKKLFDVAKGLIIDEYEKKKKSDDQPVETDEWLRAFEMVVKYDNAKDIRASQLKHEEMKLESKYLKKGQAKHFKRNDRVGSDRKSTVDECEEDSDSEKNLNRSKLDHLYDLIYALRGAPRKCPMKSNNLALPAPMATPVSDQSAACAQLVPVYVPWELQSCDPYGPYYTDGSGYENQSYYQQG